MSLSACLTLTQYCRQSRDATDEASAPVQPNAQAADGTSLSNKGATMRQHLQAMRVILAQESELKEKALLDALLSANPYPPTEAFLNVSIEKETGEDTSGGLTGRMFGTGRNDNFDTVFKLQYNVRCVGEKDADNEYDISFADPSKFASLSTEDRQALDEATKALTEELERAKTQSSAT